MPRRHPIIRPPRLLPGDLVRIIAPASPFKREVFERGLEKIQALGFRTRLREDLFAGKGFLAGEDARRAEELAEAFSDPEAKGVWCARGGYGSPRILARLDFERLLRAPKVLIGFSDPTALLNAFVKAGMVAFHGPNVAGMGERTLTGEEERLLLAAVGKPEPLGLVGEGKALVPGRAEGPLVGGNLAMIGSVMGTPFAPPFEGAILCLEEVGEKPFRIDRVLTQLTLSGALGVVAGVALGRFSRCQNGDGPPAEAVLEERLGPLKVPVVAGLPFGHEGENRVLPLGALASIDGGRLEVTEAAVS